MLSKGQLLISPHTYAAKNRARLTHQHQQHPKDVPTGGQPLNPLGTGVTDREVEDDADAPVGGDASPDLEEHQLGNDYEAGPRGDARATIATEIESVQNQLAALDALVRFSSHVPSGHQPTPPQPQPQQATSSPSMDRPDHGDKGVYGRVTVSHRPFAELPVSRQRELQLGVGAGGVGSKGGAMAPAVPSFKLSLLPEVDIGDAGAGGGGDGDVDDTTGGGGAGGDRRPQRSSLFGWNKTPHAQTPTGSAAAAQPPSPPLPPPVRPAAAAAAAATAAAKDIVLSASQLSTAQKDTKKLTQSLSTGTAAAAGKPSPPLPPPAPAAPAAAAKVVHRQPTTKPVHRKTTTHRTVSVETDTPPPTHTTIPQQLAAMRVDMDRVTKDRDEALECLLMQKSLAAELMREKTDLEGRVATLRREKEGACGARRRVEQEGMRAKIELEGRVGFLEQQLGEAERRFAALTEEAAQSSAQTQSLKTQHSHHKQTIERLTSQLRDAESERDRLQKESADEKKSLDGLRSALRDLETEMAAAQERNASLKGEVRAHEQERHELRQRTRALEKCVADLQLQQRQTEAAHADTTAALEAEIATLQSENARLVRRKEAVTAEGGCQTDGASATEREREVWMLEQQLMGAQQLSHELANQLQASETRIRELEGDQQTQNDTYEEGEQGGDDVGGLIMAVASDDAADEDGHQQHTPGGHSQPPQLRLRIIPPTHRSSRDEEQDEHQQQQLWGGCTDRDPLPDHTQIAAPPPAAVKEDQPAAEEQEQEDDMAGVLWETRSEPADVFSRSWGGDSIEEQTCQDREPQQASGVAAAAAAEEEILLSSPVRQAPKAERDGGADSGVGDVPESVAAAAASKRLTLSSDLALGFRRTPPHRPPPPDPSYDSGQPSPPAPAPIPATPPHLTPHTKAADLTALEQPSPVRTGGTTDKVPLLPPSAQRPSPFAGHVNRRPEDDLSGGGSCVLGGGRGGGGGGHVTSSPLVRVERGKNGRQTAVRYNFARV
ncbi:unnamed protein product [Vitrella brassicaformis CCMP3155]|uniref:Uncharacterized protein n=3 Tax=Vitrella brassicaformis TaxID=1169539 RepID=A0A0G4G7U9_VITBC|nr:unnamed protein product [Vitrella brassicaformis CCMP3155]|eukprot:CEM24786.1 unnamed protein product [Vitrella brassicaformis CCMP3155]